MSNTTDEIDLLKILVHVVIFFKKNVILFIVAFIVGSGLGFSYNQTRATEYQSEMIITSEILTQSHYNSIFSSIQKLISEGNTKALSSVFHIPEPQAAEIRSLELKLVTEKTDQLDKTYANIVVKSSNNAIWNSLQTGITNYIENNAFVKVRVDQKRKYYESLTQKIDSELVDLQVMKTKIMEGKLSPNNKDGMLLLDPTTINSKIIELSKERLEYQNSLELVNSVQVIEPFATFNSPVGPNRSVSLATGASMGLLFALILIGIKSLYKLTKMAEEKTSKA